MGSGCHLRDKEKHAWRPSSCKHGQPCLGLKGDIPTDDRGTFKHRWAGDFDHWQPRVSSHKRKHLSCKGDTWLSTFGATSAFQWGAHGRLLFGINGCTTPTIASTMDKQSGHWMIHGWQPWMRLPWGQHAVGKDAFHRPHAEGYQATTASHTVCHHWQPTSGGTLHGNGPTMQVP